MNFSIRTATDPDLGSDEGLTQHTLATETFTAKLNALCQSNKVFSNDHERAAELYQRAAFDTALEIGVELVQEDIPGGIQFTFNFVPTVIITEVDPDNVPDDDGITPAQYEAANEATAILDEENAREAEARGTPIQRELDTVEQYAVDRAVGNLEDEGASDTEICETIRGMIADWDRLSAEEQDKAQRQAAERAEAVIAGPCECGAGRRADGSLMCADPPGLDILDEHQEAEDALKAAAVARHDSEGVTASLNAQQQYDRFTPGNGLYFCACDGVQHPDVQWCDRCKDIATARTHWKTPAEIAAAMDVPEDQDPPKLEAVKQGAGLWSLTLDGVVVMRDESYAVVHGIIENSDVGELQEIREALIPGFAADSAPAPKLTGTEAVGDDFEALRIGRSIAYLLQLTPNDHPDAVRWDTAYGDKTYVGLARSVARLFDDEKHRQQVVLDSIDHLPCDPEDDDQEDEEETDTYDPDYELEHEEEFTDGLEDYRGGVFLI